MLSSYELRGIVQELIAVCLSPFPKISIVVRQCRLGDRHRIVLEPGRVLDQYNAL